MPYCRLETNLSLSDAEQNLLLKHLSKKVAALLQKTESYVMVSLSVDINMLFAGTDQATAYLELKSIELAEDKVPELSKQLCVFLEDSLAIPINRIYIEFINIPRSLWGWNGRTF